MKNWNFYKVDQKVDACLPFIFSQVKLLANWDWLTSAFYTATNPVLFDL